MKCLYVCLALSLVCIVSHAQTLYPRIGITASVNTYRPQHYDIKPRVGFTLGLGYNLTLSKMMSLQVELDYVQKSFESNYAESLSVQYGEELFEVHETRTDQYAISYLELPLLIKARILHDNFFVLGGFSIGMGLGGSHEYELDRTSSYLDPLHEEGSGKIIFGSDSPKNNEDAYFDNRWDFGFQVGFGAVILKKLLVECRYGLGTINLKDNADSKNRCVQITFSTPIRLKKKITN